MRFKPAFLTIAICTLMANGQACSQPTASKPQASGQSEAPPNPAEEVTTSYTAAQVSSWAQSQTAGQEWRISPMLDFGPNTELNHHRITVHYTGNGSVQVSLAHSAKPDLSNALRKKNLRSKPRPAGSGQEMRISSPYRGERYAWVVLHVVGRVDIRKIEHRCRLGKGTLYGHVAREFEFAGGKLPYRLMYPRNYDPAKSYPLVLSVSGSGGVGTNNASSMEMVILARFIYTKHYFRDELACFSLVPQIPPTKVIPPSYWPGEGAPGGPTPVFHPDWPTVNENGWYVEATLALIQNLIADKAINIDPDRVYYSGFSYGGKACWEFLKAGRGVFAAGMCGAGWPIGPAFANPAGELLVRLGQEVQRYKHIPVFIFAGERDRMRYGSRAVHKELLAQGAKSVYQELPGADHVASSAAWANPKNIAWLFRQNRRNNPPPGKDPFPGGVHR